MTGEEATSSSSAVTRIWRTLRSRHQKPYEVITVTFTTKVMAGKDVSFFLNLKYVGG